MDLRHFRSGWAKERHSQGAGAMRCLLLTVALVVCTTTARAAPIGIGSYTFSGLLSVSPLLTPALGLVSGDPYTGTLTVAPFEGTRAYQTVIQITAGAYTFGGIAIHADPPTTHQFFTPTVITPPARGVGLQDFGLFFPTESRSWWWHAMFMLPNNPPNQNDAAITGTFSGLRPVGVFEPATAILLALGFGTVAVGRRRLRHAKAQR
jgi:hypothetical protein